MELCKQPIGGKTMTDDMKMNSYHMENTFHKKLQ